MNGLLRQRGRVMLSFCLSTCRWGYGFVYCVSTLYLYCHKVQQLIFAYSPLRVESIPTSNPQQANNCISQKELFTWKLNEKDRDWAHVLASLGLLLIHLADGTVTRKQDSQQVLRTLLVMLSSPPDTIAVHLSVSVGYFPLTGCLVTQTMLGVIGTLIQSLHDVFKTGIRLADLFLKLTHTPYPAQYDSPVPILWMLEIAAMCYFWPSRWYSMW